MGGDGTYNEVVNGLPAGVPLGLLPAGATSVFARQLGWPKNVLRTAAGAGGVDPGRAPRAPIGLGRMNGRRFTFSAGFGLDAEAMRLVHEERAGHHELRRPSDLRVVAAAVRALRADGWSLPDRATLHDGERELRCSYVAVANAQPLHVLRPGGRAGNAPGVVRRRRWMSSPRATCERATCGGWACTGWCGRGTRPAATRGSPTCTTARR